MVGRGWVRETGRVLIQRHKQDESSAVTVVLSNPALVRRAELCQVFSCDKIKSLEVPNVDFNSLSLLHSQGLGSNK